MMTWTCEHKDHNGKVTTEITYKVHNDSHIHDVMQQFRNFLLAVSFTPGTVDQYIESE